MIRDIIYAFPNDGQDFFSTFEQLLLKLPGSEKTGGKVTLASSHPDDTFPNTSFQTTHISYPQIIFDIGKALFISCGQLIIANKIYSPDTEITNLPVNQKNNQSLLTIQELYQKLQNHIARIDHTGINLPTKVISESQWHDLVTTLSTESAIYNYPGVPSWKFILPATQSEQKEDIKEFPLGREPKFELVYDSYSSIPCIQIDIQTDMTREETEQLFPNPYGISFPNLADFFRTVYISHDWEGLMVRFDLRFKSSRGDLDWQTGKWLVRDGGRIK